MKAWLVEHRSDLNELGEGQDAYDALAKAIVDAWEALEQSYIDSLITSMDSRVNHVIAAKGWHTRY